MPHFRVFNQSNTFNDANTSYYHKSIGGYHGAKLRRYQELIENHISQGNSQVINMLNTKYFISPNKQARINPGALGNAWFVKNIQQVDNADQEIKALTNFNPKTLTSSSSKISRNSIIDSFLSSSILILFIGAHSISVEIKFVIIFSNFFFTL